MSQLRNRSEIQSPAVAELLATMDARGGIAPVGIEQKRLAYVDTLSRAGQPAPVAHVSNETLKSDHGPIPVRIYAAGQNSSRIVLYLHGGGFVSGDLDTHDPVCRALASGANCIVVAVEYRLAPEHPYPAAIEDARAVAVWMAQRWPGSRFVVAGDSAGGNLAAATAIWARDESAVRIAGQVLIYPVLDATLAGPSLVENALIPPFTLLDCVFMWQQYLPCGVDRRDPYVSPLHARALNGLPDAYVITAEFDILRSEGASYAERLRCRRRRDALGRARHAARFRPVGRNRGSGPRSAR